MVPEFELIFVKGFDIISAIKGVKLVIDCIIDDLLINKILKDVNGNGYSDKHSFSFEDNTSTIFNRGVLGELVQQQDQYKFKERIGYENSYILILRYYPQPFGEGIYSEIGKVLHNTNNQKLLQTIYNMDQFIAKYFLYW